MIDRIRNLIFSLLIFFPSGAAFALPVSNPGEARQLRDGLVWKGFWGEIPEKYTIPWCELFSFRLGFYGDYVFNRHLAAHTDQDTPKIEQSCFFTNAALLNLNFWDRLDLFATVGATHFSLKANATAFANPFSGRRFQIESDSHFSWSLGIRSTVLEYGFTNIGLEVQYFQTRPDVRCATLASLDSLYPTSAHSRYREWQLGIGISQRIRSFVPYLALKCSRAKLNFPDTSFTFTNLLNSSTNARLFDLENLNTFGCAVGVSLIDAERSSLTVEGRYGDEVAFHVNGQIRF